MCYKDRLLLELAFNSIVNFNHKRIENTYKKAIQLKDIIEKSGSKALIEIDGGVNLETGAKLLAAGADVLVAGSFVFKSDDPIETIKKLKEL